MLGYGNKKKNAIQVSKCPLVVHPNSLVRAIEC